MALEIRQHPEEVKEAFMEWCAAPSSGRTPPTLDKWCKLYDVERTTTWRWRQDPTFRQAVVKRVQAAILPKLPDMLEVAVQKALEGSYKHLELVVRHFMEVWYFEGRQERKEEYTEQDVAKLLSSGRFGEQLQGIIDHLERKGRGLNSAVDAEFEPST